MAPTPNEVSVTGPSARRSRLSPSISLSKTSSDFFAKSWLAMRALSESQPSKPPQEFHRTRYFSYRIFRLLHFDRQPAAVPYLFEGSQIFAPVQVAVAGRNFTAQLTACFTHRVAGVRVHDGITKTAHR